MNLSTKRKIIILATLILIDIFFGLKTETHTVYTAPMAWDVHTLSLYGFRITGSGDLFAPVLTLAMIGSYKYWFCGLTLLVGVALSAGAGRKSLAGLFNISYYIFLALAIAYTIFGCVTIAFNYEFKDLMNHLMWDILFLGSYIPIVAAFLPAGIFKVLSIYCKYKAV